MKSAVLLLAAATVATSLVYACGSDNTSTTSKPLTQTDPDAQAPEACDTSPGAFPKPGCGTVECSNPSMCAGLDDDKCGSKATCLPMADNTGKDVLDLRIRRLNIVAPSKLAGSLVQDVVVTKNIDLKQACGDDGLGAFNWLLRVDRPNKKLTTGGAPVSGDPFGAGYCFYRGKVGAIDVGPATGDITFTGSTFSVAAVDKLNIPIFVNGDVKNVVVLPISAGVIRDVTVSPDGNCVGSFNAGALGADCIETKDVCSKWRAGGTLAGYITLEEADGVYVPDLGAYLCVLLTGQNDGKDGKCPRDAAGKLAVTGDYCSTTKAPGGCVDSFWLSATFAASAAKINDGVGVAGCDGGDAGVGALTTGARRPAR